MVTPPSQPPAASNPPNFWNDFVSLYREFKVCRFALIVTVLGYVVFRYVDQGAEILRSLGEESTFDYIKAGPSAVVKWLGIVSGALMWSLAGWYACRVLLYFDFAASRGLDRPPGRWWAWLQPVLLQHLPRFFGVAPLLIMALGFWHASTTYDHDAATQAPGWLRGYAVGCVLLAGVLYVLLVYRLQLLGLTPVVLRVGAQGSKPAVSELQGGTRIALTIMAVFSLLLLILFWVAPIQTGGSLGSGAVLLYAAACWVFWGSIAVYIFERYRVPVLAILLLLVVLFSLSNDNHYVRVSAPVDYRRPTVESALAAWHANVARTNPQEAVHPLFVVSTEGGGIRAAYWTALVLGRLEDQSHPANTHFAEHVFAISSVSGGSLGAAAFDAALAGEHSGDITDSLRRMLGEDFLAAPLSALLFPDSLQRALPIPIASMDRGQWLEKAWEQAAQRSLGNGRFAENFNALWAHPNPNIGYLPALFLNGTLVESGQRIIASNVVVDQGFLDSVDASVKVTVGTGGDFDVPLSTAAHGSARFTYVSPAGRFPDGTHIVDGGYFENSGSTTALEILRRVNQVIATAPMPDVRPYVICISNDTRSEPSGGRDLQRSEESTAAQKSPHRPTTLLEDALAPAEALANTRGAHDSYAQLALRQQLDYDPDRFLFFGLSPSPIPLPLGWKLSGTAAREMDQQALHPSALDGKDNPATFLKVKALLK